MSTSKARIVSMMVVPAGDPIFSEFATTISYDDEAGGEYITLSQCRDDGDVKLKFDFDEWELINKTVRKMIKSSEEWSK